MSLHFRLFTLMAAILITAGLFAAAIWACAAGLPYMMAFGQTKHSPTVSSMICSLSGAFTAIFVPLAAARHRRQAALEPGENASSLWPRSAGRRIRSP